MVRAMPVLKRLQHSFEQLSCFRIAPLGNIQPCQVVGSGQRVGVAGGQNALLRREHGLVQLLGLVIVTLLVVRPSQVSQRD